MSASGGGGKFSAAAPMVGYMYQSRFAFTEAARRLSQGANFVIDIEKLDDVSFTAEGGETDQYQLKHRAESATLTDSSTDMWKTLRIWSEGHDITRDLQLYLVSTGLAPSGSAASFLGPHGRDVVRANNALTSAAVASKSKENKEGVNAFLNLKPSQRLDLLGRVYVFDRALTLVDLQKDQRKIFHMAVERNRYDAFLDRLEGWWQRRVAQHLRDAEPILAEELQHQIDDVRDQLRSDSLPIDDVQELLREMDANAHMERVLVLQLRAIGFGEQRIMDAVRDWMRAMSQRSRWVRDQLVVAGELQRYEKRLVDEWRFLHNEMCEELGEGAADEQMVRQARELFKVVRQLQIYLRPRCNEPSILRGSYHDLADKRIVGWHPKFDERLESLLASAFAK